jgi:hypothetical protein
MLEVRDLRDEAPRRRQVPRARRRLPPRLLLPTDRADLRISWHADDDVFILTLWHGDVCVGSAPLAASDAGEVASFLVGRLADRVVAEPATDAVGPAQSVRTDRLGGLRRLRRRLRWP